MNRNFNRYTNLDFDGNFNTNWSFHGNVLRHFNRHWHMNVDRIFHNNFDWDFHRDRNRHLNGHRDWHGVFHVERHSNRLFYFPGDINSNRNINWNIIWNVNLNRYSHLMCYWHINFIWNWYINRYWVRYID